jgi:hypothetical protein
MARWAEDGSILLDSGRKVWSDTRDLSVGEVCEIARLCNPPVWPFVASGGGGGGSGSPGPQGPAGPPGVGGGSLDCTFYVSPDGDDATADGTLAKPYKTIAAASAAIPAVGSDYALWSNRRFTIYCECGRYTEPGPIVIRQKRRSMRLQGNSAVIENEVRFVNDIADYPDGAAFNPALVPLPWINPPENTVPCFEIMGEGGGMEGGLPANNIICLGRLLYQVVSPQIAALNVVFWFAKFMQSFGGWEYENLATAPVALTTEIEGSSIVNRHIGGNGGAGAVFSLKAHNSQLRGTIGPFVTILEMDSCRVEAVDRTTDFSGAAVAGSVVSGVVTNQDHIHNCSFNGTVYNFGRAAAGGILIMDEVSLRRLLAQPGVTFTNCVARIHDILSGTTVARPTALVERGTRYYDTTLNVPIWREPAAGTGWVNGSGVAV